MATLIKDKKLIELFESEKSSTTDSVDISNKKEITDISIIEALEKEAQGDTWKGKIIKTSNSVADFFSGTKKTEFPDMPEIGEYSGEGAGMSALGILITPNQKSQAQIIQSQVSGSEIFKDRFNNIIVSMPDGKNFYLNKPGASQQDVLQTTAQILAYIPGYSWGAKKQVNLFLKKLCLQVLQVVLHL